jgi:hypothetical protein
MNLKIISSALAIAIAAPVGLAHAATETRETTIERSTSVEAPATPAPRVEETTITKEKRGVFGRKKSETTSSTVTYGQNPQPSNTNTREYKSRTTTETEKSY